MELTAGGEQRNLFPDQTLIRLCAYMGHRSMLRRSRKNEGAGGVKVFERDRAEDHRARGGTTSQARQRKGLMDSQKQPFNAVKWNIEDGEVLT